MAGVSRKPRRCRSLRIFDTTPDEEIQVAPPSSTAANGDQPRSRPAATPGSAVEQHVDHADQGASAQTVAKLHVGVLQAKREQQEEHTDLSDDRNEVLGDVELYEAAFAEHESREQVERYRGDAQAAGDPREDCESEYDCADLDKCKRGFGAPSSDERERHGGVLASWLSW